MDLITIDRLGQRGDGLAGDLKLPLTLPSERVRPGPDGRVEVLDPSPDRVEPPCPHFGTCGGCALQHASDGFLARWKQDTVARALAARGLEAPFRPIHVSPPGSRRRATFTLRRTRKTIQMGFYARGSDQLVDISRCDLLVPGMLALRPTLETLARMGASRSGAIKAQVTASAAGWDVAITEAKPLDATAVAEAAAVVGKAGVARLAWNGDVIALHRPPAQAMGRAQVVPPAGAFLQATADGQAALVAAVRDAVGAASPVADLFAGCGTFTLPLAETADVLAVETVPEMLSALDAGWRQATGLRRVHTAARDLHRRPLEPLELRKIAAVVIDPPRAGAETQAARLADSVVPVVAAVSCNPITFARDAQILVKGGYTLDWVQVIDQFRWSGHVELVARFSRTAVATAR